MPVLGYGIDIVETARIRRLEEEHGSRFLDRCFTPIEQEYCSRSPRRRIERLAGRFAVKEAVMKALGTGWRGGVAWTDIEVRSEPGGRPALFLSGRCRHVAAELGIRRWLISISHIETHATAGAIGVADAGSDLADAPSGPADAASGPADADGSDVPRENP